MSLTAKQDCFVQEYLIDLNATQAAIRAGYSPKTAEVQGSRLLANAKVREAVDIGKEARSERTGITQDEVIAGLKKEATLEGDGSSQSARVAAWGLLGKHLGIFTDNLNVKGIGPVTFVMKLHEE